MSKLLVLAIISFALLGLVACKQSNKPASPTAVSSVAASGTADVSPGGATTLAGTPAASPTVTKVAAADAAVAAAVKLVGGVQVKDGPACKAQTKPCILYGADKDSPDKGIAAMELGDPQGGGARLVFGRQANGDWDFWFGSQQDTYHSMELPAQMRICADGEGVNVRVAANETSQSLGLLKDGTMVTADSFVLTQPGSYGKPGPLGNGWYNLTAPQTGYVRADFLSNIALTNCDLRNTLVASATPKPR